MIKRLTLCSALLFGAVILSLGGCTCGFDCSSDNDSDDPENPGNNTLFTLGFTDAPAENLKQVVIEVSKITLTSSTDDDVEIENFSIPELGESNADSFQVDLLLYQGTEQLIVIEDRELPAASYSNLIIEINTGTADNSFVKDENDNVLPLLVTNGRLTLPAIVLTEDEEVHTIEFNLARSLSFESQNNVYRLSRDGVRTIENGELAVLRGLLDQDLFNDETPCSLKEEPLKGNRVYLYKDAGTGDTLGDVFDDGATDAPADVVAPYAVGRLIPPESTLGWRYEFGFLEPGDYTVAFSCDAQGDDPEDYDAITIPFPDGQRYDVTLEEGETTFCDIDENSEC